MSFEEVYQYESFFWLNAFLQTFVFISSIFSVGVYYVVVTEFYSLLWMKYLFSTVCCVVIFIILQTGSMSMVTFFIELLIAQYGTEDDKRLLQYDNLIRSKTIDCIEELLPTSLLDVVNSFTQYKYKNKHVKYIKDVEHKSSDEDKNKPRSFKPIIGEFNKLNPTEEKDDKSSDSEYSIDIFDL